MPVGIRHCCLCRGHRLFVLGIHFFPRTMGRHPSHHSRFAGDRRGEKADSRSGGGHGRSVCCGRLGRLRWNHRVLPSRFWGGPPRRGGSGCLRCYRGATLHRGVYCGHHAQCQHFPTHVLCLPGLDNDVTFCLVKLLTSTGIFS